MTQDEDRHLIKRFPPTSLGQLTSQRDVMLKYANYHPVWLFPQLADLLLASTNTAGRLQLQPHSCWRCNFIGVGMSCLHLPYLLENFMHADPQHLGYLLHRSKFCSDMCWLGYVWCTSTCRPLQYQGPCLSAYLLVRSMGATKACFWSQVSSRCAHRERHVDMNAVQRCLMHLTTHADFSCDYSLANILSATLLHGRPQRFSTGRPHTKIGAWLAETVTLWRSCQHYRLHFLLRSLQHDRPRAGPGTLA